MNKDNWLNANIKPLLALIIVSGVIGYLFMVTLLSEDNTIRSQALIAIVALGTAVVSYFYGYSQGAAKKDDTLNAIAQQPTITADTVTVGETKK